MSLQNLAHAPRRRSKRIDHAIPLTVQGADVYHAPYLDHVSTQAVSCHGCRYQSKYDVLPGDRVLLEVNQPDGGQTTCTFRARVRWTKRLMMQDRPFEIAVELEAPGNIWGVTFPPEDWFPVPEGEAIERANGGEEQPRAQETKPQIRSFAIKEVAQVYPAEKNETAPSLSPLLAQLVAGLGEQIQVMAREAAVSAIQNQKGLLLADFRAQLQGEATKTLELVILASKEELKRGALNDLKEAHEAAARSTHERWIKKIEHDAAIASGSLMAQGTELSQRIEGIEASTIERLQRHIEALRRDAMGQFVSRLREQLAPLLEEAESTLQRLAACEDELDEKSQASCARFENFLREAAQTSATTVQEKIQEREKQFESSVSARLTMAHEELHKRCAAVAAECIGVVRKLSEDCTKTAHSYLQSLAAPTVEHVSQVLKESTAEIAHQFAGELEESTRRYFESISELLLEIPKKTAIRSRE